MNDIQTHFGMLMSPEEQERIGATPDKSDSMRVMRVLSEYDRMREALMEIARVEECSGVIRKCGKRFDAFPADIATRVLANKPI